MTERRTVYLTAQIANLFNAFFVNIAYETLKESQQMNNATEEVPNLHPIINLSVFTTAREIQQTIRSLKPEPSAGNDEISSKTLIKQE